MGVDVKKKAGLRGGYVGYSAASKFDIDLNGVIEQFPPPKPNSYHYTVFAWAVDDQRQDLGGDISGKTGLRG